MSPEGLTVEELNELAGANEAKVLELMLREKERLTLEHPEFADHLEDIDPTICPRLDLINAMRRAPTPAVRMYLLGVHDVRLAFNQISGRSFA